MIHKRKTHITLALTAALLVFSTAFLSANRGKPNFGAALFGDGQVWGTKGAAAIPGPNGHNDQSFDKLFVITNGAMGQLPVAEAAPGNPNYNGGRWFTHTAMWTQAGSDFYTGGFPLLTSYDEIQTEYMLGRLMIMPGSPAGGPPAYFECPLLPFKNGN